jgi:hypothetical protein
MISGLLRVALFLFLGVCGFGSKLALAQPTDPFAVPSIMVEEPQTSKQSKRANQDRQPTKKQAEHPVTVPRGSGGFVPPAQLPRTPLLGQSQTVGPYNPPPISNPSDRITQFNHSFPLNGGLGNNPTNRDAYIRYNFNR